ncbi:glycosyltransferase family 4 protein [Salinibacter altiplanensis]|uniref:glycosyltransferase family 4 protein n=1 Tax=Salinibacter altiplanensis TaxID=1803181 RepID=UPI000C9F2522|nr:glycosyltransferase family 4 protein [Salinibacter altiplanensis]
MSQSPSILFINQHYWPDWAATAQMLTDLAEYLAAEGMDVHVLCSRGHYLSGAMDVPAEETHNGVHIHRVRATAFGRETTLGRLTDYASFGASALARVLTGPSYDTIVTLTTPPLLPVVGAVAKRLRGQPYGIWSMDLHPDAEVAAGMFAEGGLPARLLHALNDVSYRTADFVVDLGSRMKRRLSEKGVAEERLHTIPVWSRKEEVAPLPHADNPLREKLGLDGKFVVMYSGNAGVAHRFDEVLAVAKALDGHPDIEFVFVGEGPKKDRIQAFADEHDLSNFRYLPYFPREDLQYSLPMADVHLLTLREEMAGIAVPGKLYGIMAAGRPVLMVGPEDSESGETIRLSDSGRVVDPSREETAGQALRDELMALYRDADERSRLGKNARRAFLEHFEREVCCEAWASLLDRRLNGHPERNASVHTRVMTRS